MAAAVSAVDARRVTLRALDDEDVARSLTRPVRLVAAGKAATGMAAAVAARLGGLVVDGVVTVLDAAATSEEVRGLSAEVIATTHPIPGPGSERAGRRALALAHDSATSGGTLLVCLSGGASAMLVVPAAGLTVQDKADATAVLLRSGLPIQEMNLIRRQWSAIKGGRLAAAAGRSVTLAISDVPVDPADEPAAIASGPTVGQPPGRAAALAVVRREGLAPLLPPAALAALESVVDDEGAGQRDAVDARFRVVASRHDAMEAAASTARALGYATRVIAPPVVGPARDAWRALVPPAPDLNRPFCVVASGETTVRVTGAGRGGRNQELAVAALEALARHAPAALASVGTDGVDGPTDAAGAIVDSAMWSRLGARARSICDDVLDRHDSYPFLAELGGLVRTGPTGTNVGDVMVLLLPAEN